MQDGCTGPPPRLITPSARHCNDPRSLAVDVKDAPKKPRGYLCVPALCFSKQNVCALSPILSILGVIIGLWKSRVLFSLVSSITTALQTHPKVLRSPPQYAHQRAMANGTSSVLTDDSNRVSGIMLISVDAFDSFNCLGRPISGKCRT